MASISIVTFFTFYYLIFCHPEATKSVDQSQRDAYPITPQPKIPKSILPVSDASYLFPISESSTKEPLTMIRDGVEAGPELTDLLRHSKYFGWDDCGSICDLTGNAGDNSIQTRFYPFIRKDVDCDVMMKKLGSGQGAENSSINGSRGYGWPPPREPPAELYAEFTMGGKMPLVDFAYYAQRHNGHTRSEPITQKEISDRVMARAKRIGMSTYGAIVEDLVQVALSKYSDQIINKTGCDFGSSANTWLTALALLNGADTMYVVDYQENLSTHPRVKTFTPAQLYRHWLPRWSSSLNKDQKNRPDPGGIFDFVISYSSIEHSGLGRYGDALNPYGDLIAMSQIWCMLSPGSLLFLNVPYNPKGSALVWNAHRIYGPNRMAHLTANFEVLDYLDVCTMTRGLFCEHGTRLVTTIWVLKKV